VNATGLEPQVARVVALFEGLCPADVARLPDFYAVGVEFKDPFNAITGVAEVQRVFRHMFESLDAPKFVVHDAICHGPTCFLTWEMMFRFRRFDRAPQAIHGASHLVFDTQGLIVSHRDYWDAAEELYEKLPLLGALMRWLKRRVNHA
jgi:hypothetical protein